MIINRAYRAAVIEIRGRLRLLLFFYACNLAAALAIIAPAAALIDSMLGHSLESAREFANFDAAWLMEALRASNFTLLSPFTAGLAAIVGAYCLVSIFMSGGAISVLSSPRDTFFGSGARYYIRFLRLTLCSLPAYIAVLLLNRGLGRLISRLAEGSLEEHTWVMLGWVRLLLILLLLFLVNMVFDFARIIIVVEDRRSALIAAFDSVRFVWSHFAVCSAIFYGAQALGLLMLLAYHLFTEATQQNSAVAVVLVFLARQLYMLGRSAQRLCTWSAEIYYYRESAPGDIWPREDQIPPAPYASVLDGSLEPVELPKMGD